MVISSVNHQASFNTTTTAEESKAGDIDFEIVSIPRNSEANS